MTRVASLSFLSSPDPRQAGAVTQPEKLVKVKGARELRPARKGGNHVSRLEQTSDGHPIDRTSEPEG